MKMTNMEMVQRLNRLDVLTSTEGLDLDGKTLLYIRRNERALLKEYKENYEIELNAIREKYLEVVEIDTIIPATETEPERKEKKKVNRIKDGLTEEYDGKMLELLSLEVDIPIMMISADSICAIKDISLIDALDFMVE